LTSEETQDTRTAAEVVRDALWESAHLLISEQAFDIIDILAAAGYTIAGPGQVVVDRERWEMVQADARAYLACVANKPASQPGDFEPLPTQEGE
jgi:hypothetical protein